MIDRRTFVRGLLGAAIAGAAPALVEAETYRFPPGFLWSSATASYQVEGAWNVDGKGESIWDRMAHTTGKVKGAATGDVACDQYHRYREDIGILRKLNLNSYRFSVAWPRIQPSGSGAANTKGLDHYQRVVDALLEAKIRPFVTLYHWDLPQTLEDGGGWPNRDTGSRFVDYAQIVTRALGDRVKTWCIFNEPFIFTWLGYGNGVHAPQKTGAARMLTATHTVNVAQGEAFRAMKAIHGDLDIGSAFSMTHCEPATRSAEDAQAANRAHCFENLWFLETALNGRYPQAFVGETPLERMGYRAGDEERMRAKLDFLGINYYQRTIVSHGTPGPASGFPEAVQFRGGPGKQGQITDFGWEVWPDGLREMLLRITREYNGPVIEVTENGCSYGDVPGGEDHRCVDTRRIDFYRGHIRAVAQAIAKGAKIRGFHAWSLLDNFEWAEGYSQRFGLVFVDFRTQERTIKDSGYWFGKLAESGRLET